MNRTTRLLVTASIALTSVVILRAGDAQSNPASKPNPPKLLYPICVSSLWGYVDETGKEVIKTSLKRTYPFSEGLAFIEVFKTDGGTFRSCIDLTGKTVFDLPARCTGVYPFRDGLAAFETGGRDFVMGASTYHTRGIFGFIDKTGNVIIRPRFDSVYAFGEGLAPAQKEGHFGYINKSGQFVIEPKYDDAASFSEGMAPVKENAKYGFIDRDSKYLIPPKFAQAYSFHEGLAAVREETNTLFGYIDKAGKYVITPRFQDAGSFSEGLAGVMNRKTHVNGYIDRKGDMVVPVEGWLGDFHDGLAEISMDLLIPETKHYNDKSGRRIWP